MSITENVALVKENIARAARAAGRDPGEILLVAATKMNDADRVREAIKNHLGPITKAEIATQCPDISEVTIERTLAALKTNGEILKIGGGRYTKYTWNHEKN